MRISPLRWIRLFFTRPLRLADLVAVLKRLTRKERREGADRRGKGLRSRRHDERRGAGDRRAATQSKSVAVEDDPWASLGDPSSGLEVSEQPIDTLPAELRDELLPSSRPPDRQPPRRE